MPPVYYYRGAAAASNSSIAAMTDVTDYFRLYELDVTMNAEEGSVGTSQVVADDPTGVADFGGHRLVRIVEDSATGSNTTIYAGYTAERVIKRGDFHRTTDARVWDIRLTDVNTVLGRRIFDKDNADRPAETDVARVSWLLTVSEAALIDDSRYVSLVDPVNMDAADYRGQTVEDVISDCAQQSGKNYFMWYADDTDAFSLWYDFSISSNYSSPVRLSNYLSDIDETWTFAMSADTELQQDPSRVYSGIYLPYDGGFVYARRQSTSSNFASRDGSMPSINVKTAAKATARANRYLNDLDTEEDVITTSFYVPAEKVNYLMQGMRVQVRASHLPGYTDWTWMRCIMRNVTQPSEEQYLVNVELVAPQPSTPTPPVYGILYVAYGPQADGYVSFGSTGDAPGTGLLSKPTTGLLTINSDADLERPWTSFTVGGDGTIDVTFFTTTVGVLIDNISYSVTYAITVNGVAVASKTHTVSGFLQFYSGEETVIASDIAVSNGDIVRARVSCIPPTMPFFRSPGWTGQSGERLEITGGSLT